ncbi:MAG TPA: hypothetical protein VGJ26_04495 [Pirellulales bacterium]
MITIVAWWRAARGLMATTVVAAGFEMSAGLTCGGATAKLGWPNINLWRTFWTFGQSTLVSV